MDDDEKDYFYTRAEAELERSQQATHPAAVHAHYALANLYLDVVYDVPEDAEPHPA